MKLAILGAGLFAKDVYVPLCRRFDGEVTLAAVWSRTDETLAEFRAHAGDVATNATFHCGEDGLNDILSDKSIDAVAVVLPVHVSPQVVLRSLRAGKHVISEKPIAGTVEEALENIAAYRAIENRPVWNVAENFRFENVFAAQADLISKIGNVVKFDLLADMPMAEGNKNRIDRNHNAHGTVVKTRFSLSVSGTEGSVEVTRGGWSGSRGNYQMSHMLRSDAKPTFETYNFSGADKEFSNFLRQIKGKQQGHDVQDNEALKGQPEAAALDLAMIECIIKSGDVNGAPVPIPHIPDPWPVQQEAK